MISTRQRMERNSSYVTEELERFPETNGVGSWNAYHSFMKTGSWKEALFYQSYSTLQQDFRDEDEAYLDRVTSKYVVEEPYQDMEDKIGYFDQEYETYEDYDDYEAFQNDDRDTSSSDEEDEYY